MNEKKESKLRPPFEHKENTPEPVQPAASRRAPVEPGTKGERAWDSTEWNDPLNQISPAARRVAEQIDAVAKKIRNGELNVEGTALTQETAMAAALEALIRAR